MKTESSKDEADPLNRSATQTSKLNPSNSDGEFPKRGNMDQNLTTQRLEEAIQIVEARFGAGAAKEHWQLVSALVTSIALDAGAKKFGEEMAELRNIICQSAAVAAGG
jgi:hypothetical protein